MPVAILTGKTISVGMTVRETITQAACADLVNFRVGGEVVDVKPSIRLGALP